MINLKQKPLITYKLGFSLPSFMDGGYLVKPYDSAFFTVIHTGEKECLYSKVELCHEADYPVMHMCMTEFFNTHATPEAVSAFIMEKGKYSYVKEALLSKACTGLPPASYTVKVPLPTYADETKGEKNVIIDTHRMGETCVYNNMKICHNTAQEETCEVTNFNPSATGEDLFASIIREEGDDLNIDLKSFLQEICPILPLEIQQDL